MHIVICRSDEVLNCQAGRMIANVLCSNPKAAFTFATGGTPVGAYRELVRLSTKGCLDCSLATAFHLDEYVALPKENPQSYQHYLNENLFHHLHFGTVHFLDGCAANLEDECRRYDWLLQMIGVDLLLAGIGSNCHLAFNEPPADPDRTTHVENLSDETRRANARFFGGNKDTVPRQALTQGIKNIMDSRRVLLLATGIQKAEAVRRAVDGPVTDLCPASYLQHHPDATFLLDEAAAAKLEWKDDYAKHSDLGAWIATKRIAP